MSFAGIDDLELADAGGDVFQALEVVEHQVTALVGGVPAGKADSRVARIHADVGNAVDMVDELPLGLVVCLPDFLGRDPQCVAKGEVLFAPAGYVPVDKCLKRLAGDAPA